MITIPEEIKALFRNGGVLKNVRIHFPNGEREDITNKNLIAESFSFTESMCSQSELKFGLCESSVVQFEVFGIENIKGCEIEAFHEIDISSLSDEFIAEHGMTSDDVDFPFYRIPYGRFVVDECLRSADMNARSVVAYTQEAEWDKIMNPVEKAKWDGTLTLQSNLPYRFNIASVVYSNALFGDVDCFSDKTAMELDSGTYGIARWSWQDISSFWIDVKADYLFFKVDTNEVADNLYWLKYNNAKFIDEVIEETKRLIGSDEYLRGDTQGNIERITNYLKYGWWYDENGNYIPLNNYRYVYPHMNYPERTVGSGQLYDPNRAYSWICIPYRATVGYYATYGNIYPGGVIPIETISKKTFDIRDSENIGIYRVENLPQIYMSVSRKKCKKNGSTVYGLEIDQISVKELSEGFAEFSGCFGKQSRISGFEFVNINGNFGLYPSMAIYPSNAAYVGGANAGYIYANEYSSAWYGDEKTKPYDKVCVTYTNTDGDEEYMSHMLVDTESESYNRDDYQTYSLTGNYVIQNCTFSEEEIEHILQTVAEGISNVQYMPSDIVLGGRPDLEVGDVVQVITPESRFETVILRRTLSGIQCIIDNFEAKG